MSTLFGKILSLKGPAEVADQSTPQTQRQRRAGSLTPAALIVSDNQRKRKQKILSTPAKPPPRPAGNAPAGFSHAPQYMNTRESPAAVRARVYPAPVFSTLYYHLLSNTVKTSEKEWRGGGVTAARLFMERRALNCCKCNNGECAWERDNKVIFD